MGLYSFDEKSVFFSYKGRDCKGIVKAIADRQFFQRCFLPKWDRLDLANGVAWRPQLKSLIEQSDYFLFFVSPGSLAAFRPNAHEPVCRWEVEIALEDGVNITPVIWERTEDIPFLPEALLERKPLDLEPVRLSNRLDKEILDQHLGEIVELIIGDNDVWMNESMRWYDMLDDWRNADHSEEFLFTEPEMMDFERFLRRANPEVAHVLDHPDMKRFIRLNRVKWNRRKKGRF